MSEFNLGTKNILDSLQNKDFFVKCIEYNYQRYATPHNIKISLSKYRLHESHSYWIEDLKRFKDNNIEDCDELCMYKQASFLSYWLRRRMVINNFDHLNQEMPYITGAVEKTQDLPSNMVNYIKLCNEYSSLMIGINICLNYRLQEKKFTTAADKELYTNNIGEKVSALIQDMSVNLKKKSISPHSLYLLYKSIFLDCQIK